MVFSLRILTVPNIGDGWQSSCLFFLMQSVNKHLSSTSYIPGTGGSSEQNQA